MLSWNLSQVDQARSISLEIWVLESNPELAIIINSNSNSLRSQDELISFRLNLNLSLLLDEIWSISWLIRARPRRQKSAKLCKQYIEITNINHHLLEYAGPAERLNVETLKNARLIYLNFEMMMSWWAAGRWSVGWVTCLMSRDCNELCRSTNIWFQIIFNIVYTLLRSAKTIRKLFPTH